jgi:hypothetical protein
MLIGTFVYPHALRTSLTLTFCYPHSGTSPHGDKVRQ